MEIRNTTLEEIAKYFEREEAILRNAISTEKGKLSAAEMGAPGLVNIIKKYSITLKHKENGIFS
jgi:hypothetical protein